MSTAAMDLMAHARKYSDTLDIRIYQLSALVGRGAQKTVTLRL